MLRVIELFGGIGALSEDINRTSDGTMDPSAKGSKFNTVGTYIKYSDASKIVPVKVYNQIVGWFHVHDTTASKKMRSMSNQDNMLIGSVNLFANINMNDNKKEIRRIRLEDLDTSLQNILLNRISKDDPTWKKLQDLIDDLYKKTHNEKKNILLYINNTYY